MVSSPQKLEDSRNLFPRAFVTFVDVQGVEKNIHRISKVPFKNCCDDDPLS